MNDSICKHIESNSTIGVWDTTMIAAVITIIASAILFYRGNRIQAKSILNDALNNLLNLGIQYPKLEMNSFISSVTDYERDEDSMRYNLYCIAWFNHLHELFKFHKGNVSKIHNDFNCNEVVNTHKKWWTDNFRENYEGYSPDFVKYIQTLIK
ncbi:MAG: hypothetical protein JNL69_13455 [Bacteroidia bacterium]|nr:hypothetical protein [Bacteroidia bacterium]